MWLRFLSVTTESRLLALIELYDPTLEDWKKINLSVTMKVVKTTSDLELPMEPIKALCQRYHARELSIFGSALSGVVRENSDLDLLVEFEPAAEIGFVTLSRMQRELSTLLHRKVDLVPKRGLKAAIRDSVLSSARLIYEA